MPDKNPLEVVYQLHEAINRRDVETILTLFEPEATFVMEPGTFAVDTDELRTAFEGILLSAPTIKTEKEQVIEIGDIALVHARWTLSGTAPDASPISSGGYASAVLHRQPDGRWLVKIDNPLGAGILG
jgi:uncharacterized protein (TIGR02246 family)